MLTKMCSLIVIIKFCVYPIVLYTGNNSGALVAAGATLYIQLVL